MQVGQAGGQRAAADAPAAGVQVAVWGDLPVRLPRPDRRSRLDGAVDSGLIFLIGWSVGTVVALVVDPPVTPFDPVRIVAYAVVASILYLPKVAWPWERPVLLPGTPVVLGRDASSPTPVAGSIVLSPRGIDHVHGVGRTRVTGTSTIPWSDVEAIHVFGRSHRPEDDGVRIVLRSGAAEVWIGRPHQRLVAVLAAMGADVSHRPLDAPSVEARQVAR